MLSTPPLRLSIFMNSLRGKDIARGSSITGAWWNGTIVAVVKEVSLAGDVLGCLLFKIGDDTAFVGGLIAEPSRTRLMKVDACHIENQSRGKTQ